MHFNITRKTLIAMGRKLELSGQEENRKPGVISPAWNLTMDVAKLGGCVFKASVDYIVNSSAARDTQRTLVFLLVLLCFVSFYIKRFKNWAKD